MRSRLGNLLEVAILRLGVGDGVADVVAGGIEPANLGIQARGHGRPAASSDGLTILLPELSRESDLLRSAWWVCRLFEKPER